MRPHFWSDAVIAGAGAALLSGIPSTVHAWWTRQDILEATRAAGAMLIPAGSTDPELVASAALVHGTVSMFWAVVLTWVLPPRRTLLWAVLAAVGIAILDLRVIGRLFPEIYSLAFWPQFADHLAWGAVFGALIQCRWRKRVPLVSGKRPH